MSLLQSYLLENTIECTRSQFVSRLAGNSSEAGFVRVFVLSVTISGPGQSPTILIE